jgi:3-oxoacyl-[acyl-carrier-protein] synthase III
VKHGTAPSDISYFNPHQVRINLRNTAIDNYI